MGICACGEIRIFRRKQAAKKRCCPKYGVGVAGNREDAVLGKYAVDFNIGEGVRAPGHQRGEDALAAFYFSEHRIGKSDFVSLTDWRKPNEALWLMDREVAEEQGVDQSEDGGVCANAERERKNRDRCEAWNLGKDSEGISQVLPEGCHSRRSRN